MWINREAHFNIYYKYSCLKKKSKLNYRCKLKDLFYISFRYWLKITHDQNLQPCIYNCLKIK